MTPADEESADPGRGREDDGREIAFGAGAVGAAVGGMAIHETVAGQPAAASEVPDGDPGFGTGAAAPDVQDVPEHDGAALAETGDLGRDASFDLVEEQPWAMDGSHDLDHLGEDGDLGETILARAEDLGLDDPADADLDDLDHLEDLDDLDA